MTPAFASHGVLPCIGAAILAMGTCAISLHSFNRLNCWHERATALQSLFHGSTYAGFSTHWGEGFSGSVGGAWVRLPGGETVQCWGSCSCRELTPGNSGNCGMGPSWELAFSSRIPCVRSQPDTCSVAEPWSHTE